MKETVLVLGSGPIRIGQGIEFDYSCVHCVWALREMGYRAIIVNNNPETVSTDFDTGDGLYFEPVTHEDVLDIVAHESPIGVVCQFGGQTAINLAEGLDRAGVAVLGTSPRSIALAEDREQFDGLMESLGVARPVGRAVRSLEEARSVAAEVGYPVLVRPSFVLGGRAMEIVHGEGQLAGYYAEAEAANPGQPVLVDRYLEGVEAEVDVISDGEDTLVPGIMEHIERAGVHSGDSMAVYPPVGLSYEVQARMVEDACRIAKALGVRGLMNIQFVVAPLHGSPRGIGFQPMNDATDQSGIGFQPMDHPAADPLVSGRPLQTPEAMSRDNLPDDIRKRQGAYLPHWRVEEGTYAVTFRTYDSLPQEVADTYRTERDRLREIERQGLLSETEIRQRRRQISERVENLLDESPRGPLSDESAHRIVAESLAHFSGERYDLHAYAVMPNHVHVLLTVRPGYELSEIVHSWKSFTANRLNELWEAEGPVWQKESFDHIVRSVDEFEAQATYIVGNPRKAGGRGLSWRVEEEPHRYDSHRLEADATMVASVPHRLEADATGATEAIPYVLEVNPRASRTVPYLSKVTSVPMVDLATRCMMGEKLRDLGYGSGLWSPREKRSLTPDEVRQGVTVTGLYAVKAPVFSFQKLGKVEPSLGPEMKSTGEIMGIDTTYEGALYKALVAAGIQFKGDGAVMMTVRDEDKATAVEIARGLHASGRAIVATGGTARALRDAGLPCEEVHKIQDGSPSVLDTIMEGRVSLLINTPSAGETPHSEAARLRRACIETGVPCVTSIDTAGAILSALDVFRDPERSSVRRLEEYLAA